MTWKLTTTSTALVGQRQRGQIAVMHLHPRVAGPDVRDRCLVVVDADHPRRHVGDHVRAVALARARLQHHSARRSGGQLPVHDFVPAEPVVLLGDAGHGSLAGQRQTEAGANALMEAGYAWARLQGSSQTIGGRTETPFDQLLSVSYNHE